MIREEAKEIYYKAIQKYKDNPDMLMSEILDESLSKYNNKEVKELNEIIGELMNASVGSSSGYSYKLSNFEITVDNLYREFISSDSIKSLSYSIKKLKRIIDYFKKNGIKENLVMPIRDFEMLSLELDALGYGLSHWSDIKEFIISSSNKQVDIQKGLDLDKQKLSTFLYILNKLGFIEKETLKNRVYVKRITDKGNT